VFFYKGHKAVERLLISLINAPTLALTYAYNKTYQ